MLKVYCLQSSLGQSTSEGWVVPTRRLLPGRTPGTFNASRLGRPIYVRRLSDQVSEKPRPLNV